MINFSTRKGLKTPINSYSPEGEERSYYIKIEVGQGKVICKSKERLAEGSEVGIEGENCKPL